MPITPNRHALKELACFNVDAHFVQLLGNQFFGFSGYDTEQHEDVGQQLERVVEDIGTYLENIKKAIPAEQE